MSRISTKKFEGVYYRECRRTYQGKKDRAFDICWQENGKKHWRTVGHLSEGTTAQDAYQQRLSLLTRVHQGEPAVEKTTDPTVTEVMEGWLAARAGTRANGAPANLFTTHIKPAVGTLRLSQLNLPALERLKRNMLERKLAPGTIQMTFTVFKTAITYASQAGLWDRKNPVPSSRVLNLPKVDNKGERFLTREEAGVLLTRLKASQPMWYDMARLSLYTGMRLTELYKLRGQDLNIESSTLIVSSKLGVREPVLLVPEALDILKARQPGQQELFFPCTTSVPFTRVVNKLGLNNGVTDRRHRVWFHTLRHTFASWLAQSGVDLYAIQKLMRHRNITMTQRYAHLMPERQRRHLEIVRESLAGLS
jgi:integrase